MKKKTGIIAIAVLLIILIVMAGVIVFLLLNKDNDNEPLTDNNVYTMSENNYVQIMEDMDAGVQEGYFETYMNTDWTFEEGTSLTTDAVLGNSPNNVKPIRCEVLLDETGEKVFSTGVIPVGAQVPAFKLDVDLDAGVYNATCMVYLLNETGDGTYTDYSSAGFNVTITVKN